MLSQNLPFQLKNPSRQHTFGTSFHLYYSLTFCNMLIVHLPLENSCANITKELKFIFAHYIFHVDFPYIKFNFMTFISTDLFLVTALLTQWSFLNENFWMRLKSELNGLIHYACFFTQIDVQWKCFMLCYFRSFLVNDIKF